jgi:hypothetical protein
MSMSEIVGAWKKHTGRLANRLLGKTGTFWAAITDTFMRGASMNGKWCYIENNPTKAKLVLDAKGGAWSSARFRNEFGVLKLPESFTLLRVADPRSGARLCEPQQR